VLPPGGVSYLGVQIVCQRKSLLKLNLGEWGVDGGSAEGNKVRTLIMTAPFRLRGD
jgi:hypothetical protein